MDNIRLYIGILIFLCLFSFADFNQIGKFLAERKIIQIYKNSEKMLGFGLKEYPSGLYIADVLEMTPAQKAGVEEGDKILEVEGKRIASIGEFKALMEHFHKNKSLNLVVYRKISGKDVNVNITPLVLIPSN